MIYVGWVRPMNSTSLKVGWNPQLDSSWPICAKRTRNSVSNWRNCTEQIEYLNRQLFGRRSEKIPTVRDDIRRQSDPNELTVDGAPMPIEPEARAKEKRRKARRAAEPLRKKRRCARKALPMIIETHEV